MLVKAIDEIGARHYMLPAGGNLFCLPGTIWRLASIIRKENIDLVHARDGFSSFVSFFASRMTLRPYVASIYTVSRRNLFERAEYWANLVLCASDFAARSLAKKNFISKNRVRTLPAFLDLESYRKKPVAEKKCKTFTIGVSLGLSSMQSYQGLIRAVAIAGRSIGNLKVIIDAAVPSGGKEGVERLELLVKRHSLERVVTLLTAHEGGIFSCMPDLFISVLDEAHFSARPILESYARGIPVLVNDTEYAREYAQDKKTALLFVAENTQEFASKIVELYRGESLRARLIEGAGEYVLKNFNAKKIMKNTLKLYEEASSGLNILIIKIGALGDAILITPSVKAIRHKFPNAKLEILTGIEQKDIFFESPDVDETIVCDLKERDRGPGGTLRLARRLRKEHFDIVIDFQNNKISHILSFLSMAPRRYGYDNGKFSFLLNRKLKLDKQAIGPVEHQARVLALLGIQVKDKTLRLSFSEKDKAWADNFLESHWVNKDAKVVAVHMGSSPRWATKLWPITYFVELCGRLVKNADVRILLIGEKKEDGRLDAFLKKSGCKPISAAGKTNIPRLAALLERCKLLVTSDSAPMHVAAAAGTPFIGLFGPTDPARHAPPAGKFAILKKNLECSPCYKTHCKRGNACMREITPDEVYDKAAEMLGINKNTRNRPTSDVSRDDQRESLAPQCKIQTARDATTTVRRKTRKT